MSFSDISSESSPYHVGHISGYPPGSTFDSRAELSAAGVHRPLQAGICGSQEIGAESIVLSGGYEDDVDRGDVIIYTGHGGRDSDTAEQIADQVLDRGNLALARSMTEGLPVRVIRGSSADSPFAPDEGYRYDGLYRVDDYWRETGQSGYKVWRFRLEQIEAQAIPKSHLAEEKGPYAPPPRVETTILRTVQDTKNSRYVKELYDYRCQVCGERLAGPAGPYAEAAHIQPLGEPHLGPDMPENILCLCPNHHALFDLGAFTIADDYQLLGLPGELRLYPQHTLHPDFLRYRREHYQQG